MIHLDIIVRGKVQGVNFRHYTTEKAKECGLTGFVENREDGTVHIEAEGDPKHLEAFVDWCRRGPARAEVEKIETVDGPLRNYSSFEIRRA
jgi:acylphosphatase